MTQYNSLNVKLSNSQLNEFRSGVKNVTDVILIWLSSNMIGNSDDETNFSNFANCTSANIKLSKAQLSKIVQSRRFLGRILGPLLKTGLPLMKNVTKPLT